MKIQVYIKLRRIGDK